MTKTAYSVKYLETLSLACCGRKNDLQTNIYLWQECALEQTKAKITHLNTICNSVCFMVELEFFLIVNMSRSFVPPIQKCALLGVGSIPDPLSHTGRAILISLSFILSILESLLIESTLLKLQVVSFFFQVVSFKLIKEGLQMNH